MIKNKPSTTALATTLIRASSRLDYVAHIFLPQPFRFFSHFNFFNNFIEKKFPKDSYQSVVSRTKFIDNIFETKSFDQVVIFGAGFDSRFIRFYNPKTKFFEVDVKETQQNKIDLIKKSKYKINKNVVFIPFNLNNKGIIDELIKKSFGQNKKTLFLLEGLIMYLKPENVSSLFESIYSIGSKDSEITFDYINSKIVNDKKLEANKTVDKLHEHWLFGINNINNFIQDQKMTVIKTQKFGNGGIVEAKTKN
jgi:methyltransferase (TIGR00027 family)